MSGSSGNDELEKLLIITFGQLMIRSDSYPSVGELVDAAMLLIAGSNQQAIEAYQTDYEQHHIASAIEIAKQEAVEKALEGLDKELDSYTAHHDKPYVAWTRGFIALAATQERREA